MRAALKYFAAACGALAFAMPAWAAIVNGGFESGFAGWTRVSQVGSEGGFMIQAGAASPLNGFPVPAPPGGSNAAMTDSMGPGSHVLFQDFVQAAPVAAAVLNFDLYVNNRADNFYVHETLDFATPALNQQARVDILLPGGDPFSLALGDILQNVFQSLAGDPLVSGYTHFSVDITALVNAHLNTPLRLRFSEVDNVNFFNLGVDNVDITVRDAAVPEPATWMLLAAAMAALAAARRRSITQLLAT